jgi:sporulation protein YlmC with PRC-barrel domain
MGHTTAIRAGKAIGTDVYDMSGKKIGEVKDIVLEKTSNNILFAVVSFGGVLGMGEKYHPVPWSELDYDPQRGGYSVSFTRRAIEERSVGLDRSPHEGRRTYVPRSRVHALRNEALLALTVRRARSSGRALHLHA